MINTILLGIINYLFFLRDPQYMLGKYKLFLRKEEYCLNNPTKWNTIKRLYFLRRKNIIGNKLGVLIPPNTFGKGLQIMHHGSIIVNPDVRVGDYCVLHGNNCIGNNEKNNNTPTVEIDLIWVLEQMLSVVLNLEIML